MAKTKNELKVNETINLDEIKEELTDYIDGKIKKGFKEEVENINRRVIKDKNRTIFFKNIIIIILILIIGFLGYLLYRNNYFDNILNKNEIEEKEENNNQEKTINNEVNNKEEKEKEEESKKIKEELKKKYSSLLDNFIISEDSIYLNDYYNGKLSSEIKNYLSLNRLNFNDIDREDDYNLFSEEELKDEFNKLFNDEYLSVSFDYNGNKIRFIDRIKTFITSSLLENKKSNIKKEIISINEEDNMVIINTVEGIIIDNKLYDINNNLIEEFNNDGLLKYQDKLNKMSYIFKDGLLYKLEKVN